MTAPLAITCGDPSGVGPEIAARWAAANPALARNCAFIGPRSWVDSLPGSPVPVGNAAYRLTPGSPSEDGAQVAAEALEEAARGCAERRYSGVVTGPVSKEWLARMGYRHPGQTEFFAERWGGTPTMAFVGEKLKVILATWHIPLMKVREALTTEAITTAVERAAELGKAFGTEQPRIAMCGLNPHAGEAGLLGDDEKDFIDPLLERLREVHPGLSRSLPSDTVFYRAMQSEFDVVVALYHDQGLAPLKTVDFHTAVNVTMGLPWVRTSPDHGTAFGIAGKGLADIGSFTHAVQVALRLIEHRNALSTNQ